MSTTFFLGCRAPHPALLSHLLFGKKTLLHTLHIPLHHLQLFGPFEAAEKTVKRNGLIKMVHTPWLIPAEAKEFFEQLSIPFEPSFNQPTLQGDQLAFTKTTPPPVAVPDSDCQACLPLAKKHLTRQQLPALALVSASFVARQSLLLFSPSGTDKTHLNHTLAKVLGQEVGLVQFSAERDNSQIIRTIEHSCHMEESRVLKKMAVGLAVLLVETKKLAALPLLGVVKEL